jgi:diguanylate cyclase (GGDEF)-like protein/PAS domain S-box-containing protein
MTKNHSTIWRFILPVLILLAVAPFVLIQQQTSQQLDSIQAGAKEQARSLVRLLNVTNELVGEQVNVSIRLLKAQGKALGEPSLAGIVSISGKVVPNLMLGETQLFNNFRLVDDLSSLVGGTATLFVKSGTDFVRVTTNVHRANESRAIGTILNPNGKAIIALRDGKSFQGVVDILDEPYITRYDPIYDGQGNVIGAYYVGYKVDMKVLREAVQNTRQLKSGFAMVLDNNNKIRFLSSHISNSQAEHLLHEQPENWKFVREDIPNWGFSVVVAYPLNEARVIGLANSWFVIGAGTLLGGMLIIIILWQLQRLILNPIGGDPSVAIDVVKRIAAGDLENDGLEAKPNTLMSNVLRMRTKLRQNIEELKNSEFRWKFAIESSGDCIWDTNEKDQTINFSNSWSEMIGYSEDEVMNRLDEWEGRIHPEDKAGTLTKVQDCLDGKASIFVSEYRICCKDGSYKWILDRGMLVSRSEDGKPLRMIGTSSDVTARKLAENDLQIAATAFESQEGILVTDANNIILRVNRSFTNITGYTAEEAVGKTPRLLSSGQHDAVFFAKMWESINNTGVWAGEIWNKRKNGEVYPEYLIITAVKHLDGVVTNYVATLTDITERKRAADEIEHLAYFDHLTRLPNRRLLIDRLRHALTASSRSGRDGALLFLDLDHFKTINDTLGHDVGDVLLQQVAERLISCIRESDTVARLGGDEYVVMLEDLSEHAIEAAAQAETIGEKILSALNQPFRLDENEYHVTPSIGVALFSSHEKSFEDLLKHADIAMYHAKKAGRNTLRFFDPKMQEVIHARVDLERELRKALEKEQFQLYYQIQVDITDRPMGAEALIRWIHPERGLISPFHFIPLAEETGLILSIGQWVLETACSQLRAWQNNSLTRDLTISINVSAKQFYQADFVTQVQAAICRHEIDPMLLKLELTESILLENIEDTVITMNALKEIGIRFSLDDFGTGYSSLQYLKRLPLYQLKIDQSFVRDIATDSSDQAIVRTIIAMAHMLNLNVIAEGVETSEQQGLLLNGGCSHYQGYLFGRPVPIEEFESTLKKS